MSRRRLTPALLILSLLTACGGGGAQQQSAQDQRPEITLESIREDLNGEWVDGRVPAADGKSQPRGWAFDHSEPKQIEIVEQKIEGDRATFLINMQTRTGPRSRDPISLSGQLRLHYELESGLVFRKWEIVRVENVSFKYVKETPPPDANANNANANSNANSNANVNSNAKPKAGATPQANANASRTGEENN
ncbi:MAG: hypothetical protein LC785_08640 [Acidobacteria bacterium]|nr:hypothetical protein [Acidobacteriota bacterium]MCA1642001.1 hypothetical protein [Acidobacteriota bacterium]